jgi:hypothetical protein
MMTVEEMYEFDLNGYIVYRQVLSSDEVDRARRVLSEVRGSEGSGKFAFFDRDPLFVELMARPQVVDILKGLLGEWLRFDHAFGIEMTDERSVTEFLHAGNRENQGAFAYEFARGRMHNGLVKVQYQLNDVAPGDGGFVCVPGSHKANVEYKPRKDSRLIINPPMQAGDALIFTEALVHGSRHWRGGGHRKVLIYSYAPGCLAWKNPDTVRHYLKYATTDLQRALLRPPSVGEYNEKEARPEAPWPMDRREPVGGTR